ncbi:hypothetical protein CAI21_05000 [Alkalilimnicola ehrlichii]|uniref:DUF2069 domain-containing protein n=1 Tax=Alkalilimnicola ehrlichii TaxID=351052 RepID=A0A3E0WYV7_9GAMM|nr:DUF2069 domain-containing protein [Alkalilimnicola ehrlichii]RFA30436.1 hypothetical protein CAI21_05000 [Alkalilimnicola ehrlichii]RFA37988.1 hypothetical protein CAL65_06375 [Alkalilimnicola ehrlichii]
MNNPRTVHLLAVTCYLSLFALLMAWLIWLAPPAPEYRSIALIFLVGPLLLPLRGILHARRYTFSWSGMLILIYFVHGIASMAAAGPARWLGAIEIVLSLSYFILAIRYLRITGSKAANKTHSR